MCRLLGWATPAPTTLARLLGAGDLGAFTELSCKHGDGWGMARAGDGTVLVDKEAGAARTSERFAAVAQEHSSDLAMVHLRWATLGLPVAQDNAHPFTSGRLAFAHNGSIAPPSAVEELLDDRTRRLLRGDTDSERFFLAVLSRLDDHDAPDDAEVGRAYAETVRTIRRDLRVSSLNSMLLTPTTLFAVCSYDPEAAAREDEADYYRLRLRVATDAVVVASSGWGSDWSELDNDHLLAVDRRSLTVTTHPLG